MSHIAQITQDGPALDAALAQERARIARWLHDSPLQALEFIAQGGWCEAGHADPTELVRAAAIAAEELRRFIEGTDTATARGSFMERVREVVAAAHRAGVQDIELVHGPTDGSSDPTLVDALVGALSEAFANVRKHSGATTVVVYCEEENGAAVVTVRDDGIGASPDLLHGGFGVRESIVARMRAAGGWAFVESPVRRGVTVRLGANRREVAR